MEARTATGHEMMPFDFSFFPNLSIPTDALDVSTFSNIKNNILQIREKFHKLFLRENQRFVKHPPAQNRDADFHSRFGIVKNYALPRLTSENES